MSYSGDAAEQVVRMSLEGAEVAAKITGAGAKQVAILLYAILREQKKTKGKTRLTNMLRSGKELKVFAVKDTDLKQFCEASNTRWFPFGKRVIYQLMKRLLILASVQQSCVRFRTRSPVTLCCGLEQSGC